MSIEGMWAMLSAEVGETEATAGGVVIFETGRIFGGDSAIAYVGSYSASETRVEGRVERWRYNLHYTGADVFGAPAHEVSEVAFSGERAVDAEGQDTISGEIWRVAEPHLKLPIFLKKMRDLP